MKNIKNQQAQAITAGDNTVAGGINVLDFEVDFEHVKPIDMD